MSTREISVDESAGGDALNLGALIPEHFARWIECFKPGHIEGIVPSRVKELARLKVASINQCDT